MIILCSAMHIKNIFQARVEKPSYSISSLLIFFTAFVLFITGYIMPRNWGFYGLHDWDLTYFTFEVVKTSIVDFGQFPHYNLFASMGSDLWSNPQSVMFNPLMLPVLLWGSVYGLKIGIVIAMIWGCFGGYFLFKQLTNHAFHAVLLAGCWISTPYLGRHVFEAGHSNFVFLYALPWIFYWTWQFMHGHNRIYVGYISIYQALMLAGGAPMMFVITTCLMGMIMLSLKPRNVGFPFVITGLLMACIVPVIIAFFKLYPVIQHWQEFPRLVFDNSSIGLLTFFRALEDRVTITGTPHLWLEHSLGFPLVLVAIMVVFRKNIHVGKLFWVFLGGVLWLSLGNNPIGFNPWFWAHHYLPVFNGIRSPYRWGIVLVMLLYFLLSMAIKGQRVSWLTLLLIFVAFSQAIAHTGITRLFHRSPRLAQVFSTEQRVDTMRVAMLTSDFPYQWVAIQNHVLLPNAYEPMMLSPISDTLQVPVKGGQLMEFTPNRLVIRCTHDTTETIFRHTDKPMIRQWSAIDNRISILHKKGQTVTLDFSYFPPIWVWMLSIGGLCLLLGYVYFPITTPFFL
jgi:hypothetical protein